MPEELTNTLEVAEQCSRARQTCLEVDDPVAMDPLDRSV